jgi:hypothetical protein
LPEGYKARALRIIVGDLDRYTDRLRGIGFSEALTIGEMILPAIVGPISRFNAEGKQIVRRDLEMETAYRQVEWHWTEFHGDDRVKRSDIRDVLYKRYSREPVSPPSLELLVGNNNEDQRIITTAPIEYNDQSRDILLHAINLCPEIFGECSIFTEDFLPATRVQLKRLNWHVLPPGRYPWERVQASVRPIVERAKKGNQAVIARRLELISDANPEFVAIWPSGLYWLCGLWLSCQEPIRS